VGLYERLPEAFRGKMVRLLGEAEAQAFFAGYGRPRAVGLRANTLKVAPERLAALLPFKLAPVPWCAEGFVLETEAETAEEADAAEDAEAAGAAADGAGEDPGETEYETDSTPGKHPLHAAGLYYMQDPSAMYPAAQLGARPGERVLDLCAAPGGKTTQLGAAMGGRGVLIANEYEGKRAKVLSENVERLGLVNCVILNESPERLRRRFPEYFDRILVDAPCSGEGMFRKDPSIISHWKETLPASCARTQLALLEAAAEMLAPGGTLVYSTCTFSPEENERVVEALLARRPELTLKPMRHAGGVAPGVPAWSETKNPALAGTARLWPHRLRGEGHFAAMMEKRGAPSGPPAAKAAARRKSAPGGPTRR